MLETSLFIVEGYIEAARRIDQINGKNIIALRLFRENFNRHIDLAAPFSFSGIPLRTILHIPARSAPTII